MTELTCWPLDNKPYTSVALGAAYAARSRGVLNADSFTATTNGDNTITVGKGVGCIHVSEQWAAFPLNEGDVLLTFADADGVYPRWDVIALVYDKNANTAGLEVREGLAAETPTLPALRRDDDYDEIFLYRVTRPVGATKITADNVVDLRLDNTVCGLMRDTIDAIDTQVMQAAFAAFLAQIETELNQLHAGTATMLRAVYDPQDKQTDVFKYADDTVAGFKYVLAILIPSKWSDTAPYTYTIDIPGMTEDWQPGVPWHNLWEDLYTNHMSELIVRLQELAKIKIIRSNNGSLTFIAPEEKPTGWLDICVPGESYSGNEGNDNK